MDNAAELEEFKYEFKKRIIDNEEVMKRIHKAMKPFFKMPLNSDVVKKQWQLKWQKFL